MKHFYTTPGLVWQALIKIASKYWQHKDCELCLDEFRFELLRDIDILLMLEKHISGGITEAVKCYANANNKCMKDQYKPDGTSTYLQYLDAHNIFILEKIDQWVKKKRKGIFQKLMKSILKLCTRSITSCHFCKQREWKSGRWKN